MIWRAWIVLSILWCTFWIGMYVTLGPLTIGERLALRADLTLVTALPWIAGLVIHRIATGHWS